MEYQNDKYYLEAFRKWVINYVDSHYIIPSDDVFAKVFCLFGLEGENAFLEVDSIKVRIIVSDLILKRSRVRDVGFCEFNAVVDCLIKYADFLDVRQVACCDEKRNNSGVSNVNCNLVLRDTTNIPTQTEGDRKVDDQKLMDSLTIALFLAREKDGYLCLGHKNWKSAFEEIGRVLGQKPSTLKNMRDEFDPYYDNGRAGWYQRELRSSRRIIYDRYLNVSQNELAEIVRGILEKGRNLLPAGAVDSSTVEKTNETKNDGVEYIRLKMHNYPLKEIKTKKR